MSKRIVVVSDIQFPYHDRKALSAVIRFIGDYQPDEVVFIGDMLDFPQPSRWVKDTKAEFEGGVLKDAARFQVEVLDVLREVYQGPVGMHEGNHDLRPREYLAKYAPALGDTNLFNVEELCRFDQFDITLLPTFYAVAPGWITTHGHMGGISLSRIAGNTALNAAKRFDKSVVMGHTHRMGVGSFTVGHGGRVSKILTGMEVGNLMDMRSAPYLKEGTANWQQGFAILTVHGQHVKPEPVPIARGSFLVDGHIWKV